MKPRPKALARRLVASVVMLLAVGPAVALAAPPAQAATPSAASVMLYEYQVINGINAQRASYHLGRLYLSPCPQYYANRWAPFMVWYFQHQSMYPILAGCHATVAAENLALGNVSAGRIVAAWMASPGHRANILDGRLNRIGVAAIYARGRWNITADFTRS
jgi:uncharacterized protein YkwD